MNIFFVDTDPRKAAQSLCDKHVVKMILESAQLLSTAHRVMDGVQYLEGGRKRWRLEDSRDELLYKATHWNHPCCLWIQESVENYNWLAEHFHALLEEYIHRYGKVHKCQSLCYDLMSPPFMLKIWDRTPVKLAMPEEFKRYTTESLCYREYYISKQYKFSMKWTSREIPDWFITKEKIEVERPELRT